MNHQTIWQFVIPILSEVLCCNIGKIFQCGIRPERTLVNIASVSLLL
nr:MAG TPA: hypothetical protein [Caudoviricetes sp.]